MYKMPRVYRRKTTDDFIDEARAVHGDAYTYPRPYNHSREKIEIVCPTHGSFFQYPYSHLAGNGCRQCDTNRRAKNNTLTHKEFVTKAASLHNNRYTYATDYVHSQSPLIIICPDHGEFAQLPAIHLRGHGCPTCRITPPRTPPSKPSGGSGTYGPAYFEMNPNEKGETGYFYAVLLTIQDTQLLKVGITKNIEKRLTNYSRFKCKVVSIEQMSLYDAYLQEQQRLSVLSPHKYTGDLYFSGHTECFTITEKEYLALQKEDDMS